MIRATLHPLAPATLLVAAAVGLVGWARVRLGHPAPAQVVLGAGITAVCIGFALAWWDPQL